MKDSLGLLFTDEENGAEPSLVGRGQSEVTLRRGQEEGDAEDLDGVGGVGPAADEQEEPVELAIA